MLIITWQEGNLNMNLKLMNVILLYHAFNYCTVNALSRLALNRNHKLLLELKITTWQKGDNSKPEIGVDCNGPF